MDRILPPNPTSRLHTSTLDTTKHTFAIRPFIPSKKRTPLSLSPSPSPLINRSQDQRPPNGSKSLRTKKPPPSQRSKIPQIPEIQKELIKIQASYKSLKKMHKQLKSEWEMAEEGRKEMEKGKMALERELEKMGWQSEFYQQEFERIKKQCLKLLEIQGFKNKKMEQTLQEKQLMIQYLKNQLSVLKPQQPTTPFPFPLDPLPKYNSTANNSHLSLISLQDILALEATEKDKFLNSLSDKDDSHVSLNFSKDKSKMMISSQIHTSFNSSSASFDNERKISDIQHHCLSVNSFENISFSGNLPEESSEKEKEKEKQKFSVNKNNKENLKISQKEKEKEKEKEQVQKGFKKSKLLEINVDDISTIDEKDRRKQSCAAKTKRRKSEAEEKMNYETSMRSKYQNLKDKRTGITTTTHIR